MRTDCLYEVLDSRPDSPLAPIGAIQTVPGGLKVGSVSGRVEFLPIPDDEDMFLDDEAAGVLSLELPEGRVVFNRLTLEIWNDYIEPYWGDERLDFKSEGELDLFMRQKLVEG